jgi:hypothetical protein
MGGNGPRCGRIAIRPYIEEQCGNRRQALGYAREALEWSRRLGMVKEQAQAEAICARLSSG